MTRIVRDDWKRMKSFESIEPRLDQELRHLVTRQLKRATAEIAEDGKKKIKRSIDVFFADAGDLLMRYLPDFDLKDFVKSTQNKIQMDTESSDLFSLGAATDEPDYGLGDMVWDLLNGASWGLLGVLGNFLSHSENVAKVEKYINSISADFDPSPYLDTAFARKEEVITLVKSTFITELIEPLQEQIKEIREQKDNKEKELQNAKDRRDELESSKATISIQISSLAEYKKSFL